MSDGDGYGTGGYGEGGYGNNNDDPPMTDDPIDFNDAINERIDQRIDARLDDSGGGDGGVTESRVLELIDKALADRDESGGDEDSGGDTNSDPDPELAQRLDRLEQRLDRLNPEAVDELFGRLDSGLDRFEQSMGLRATIGPAVPEDGYAHPNPGWGIVFETDDPLEFGECTCYPTGPGTTVAELHRYDGESEGLVDSTRLTFAQGGEQSVTLDLSVPESGTYILTRDHIALDEGDLQGDERVALWRTSEAWDGWGEVANGLLDLKEAACSRPEYTDTYKYWYSFFSVDVQAISESEG